jgi:hypothetical protein
VKGDSSGWITSAGFDILTPPGLLGAKAALVASGTTQFSEHLGGKAAIFAELRVAGRPPERLEPEFELRRGPRGAAEYRIRIRIAQQDLPADRDVPVHVWFDRYFVPARAGISGDTRQLVIQTPRAVRIAR